MGGAQSTPAQSAHDATAQRILGERLRSLSIKDDGIHEKDYVYIDASSKAIRKPFMDVILTGLATEPSPLPTKLPPSTISAWEKSLLADPKNRLALSALLSNPITDIVKQKVATLPDTQTFNVKIKNEGSPITNQRSSGRCWLFASTNVLRVPLMKKYNLAEFELSQSYLFFYDKIEKANWFLEQIIDTASSESLDSRIVQELLGAPVNDGGQWDMAANLVSKYGLVPQVLYPDSFNAMNSRYMGSLLTTKLREDALILREMIADNSLSTEKDLKDIAIAKARMMQEVHLILTLMLGPPPPLDQPFTWQFYDKDGTYRSVSITPSDFASSLSAPSLCRQIGADVTELFSLVHDPRHPYNTLLTVSRLGNVVGGRPITYVNVPLATMKAAAIAMLRANLPVFFGSDVGKFSDGKSGIMDTRLYDYSLAFNTNISLGMSKSDRLRSRESQMTHAMVLTGVQVERSETGKEEKSVRWRVMNSWGEGAGEKGFFVMSDGWWDQFVYQVVVDPGFVGKEVRDVLKTEPVVLPLWDPMGALA